MYMAHKTLVLVLCGQHRRTSFRHLRYKDVLIDLSICLEVGYLLPTEMVEIEGISQITLINGVFQIQGPPKKYIHTLTKENSTLYNRLL